MNRKNISVLSLFDGISVAQLAITQLGIPIENYFASEIDKNAIKVTQYHFPNTIQLGDVRDIDCDKLPPIDLVVFGSPCQDLSILRKDRKGIDGDKSRLFYEALRILDKVRPRIFIMENVNSMRANDRNIITNLLGVKPIKINSNLVSAQNRNRIYWTNIPGVKKPLDRKITLQSIIQNGFCDRRKSLAILTKNIPFTSKGLARYIKKSIGQVAFKDKDFANASKDEKLDIIEGMTDDQARKLFRVFSIEEQEKLQTLPFGYVGKVLKKTPSHHVIGNAFTNETIKHILSFANFNTNQI